MTAQLYVLETERARRTQPDAPVDILTARDQWGRTPLLAAILDGSALEVRALLRAGANPNDALTAPTATCFSSGETALMLAAAEPQKLKLLLKFGADPMAGPHGGLAAWMARELDEDNGDVPEYFEGLEKSRKILRRRAG